MWLPPGVSADDMELALLSNPKVTTRLEILTNDHKPLGGGDITEESLSGQVNWMGRSAEVSRTAQLDVYDPGFDLHLDSDSPKTGAVYADRFLRITQIIDARNLTKPAEVPVITGPLAKFTRPGVTVALEVHGKELLMRTDVPHLVCKKGMYIVDAIEKIARHCGERFFRFPTGIHRKLNKDIVVGRDPKHWPWPVMLRLADTIGKQLFYDGLGYLVLREPPDSVAYTFTPIGEVSKEHDWTQVFNRVEVKYSRKNKNKTKTKKDDTIKGQVVLTLDDLKGKNHPFGPHKMSRTTRIGGEERNRPWTRTLTIEDDKINFRAEASDIARKKLKRMAVQSLQLKGTVVPAWHLEPSDVAKLDGDRFRFGEAAAPVGGPGEMTVGYIDHVKPKRHR